MPGVWDARELSLWRSRWSSPWSHKTLYEVGGTAKFGFRDACGRFHRRLRWSSLWGHEALYWVGENAKFGFRDACGRSRWGLRWSSLWGHEVLYWVGETQGGRVLRALTTRARHGAPRHTAQ
eukprot:9051729-Pyramimonas_sp.AAC.1